MAEVNQWMRMIQPARARTPAIEHQDISDELDISHPNTPKRGLRPKISSYFNLHADPDGQMKREASTSDDPLYGDQWPHMDPPKLPRAGGLVETIMSRLISSPYEALGVDMNGPLLQICEAYRSLCDSEASLQRQLETQLESHHAAALKMQQIQNRWNEERQDYRAEVKRLELLLAKGRRGLAEVTLARRDSLLWQRKRNELPADRKVTVDDGLQTIFEVLERARHGQDLAYNSQRATFRHRAASPSAHMRCISQQLISKKSMTNIHTGLPFGSPPDMVPSTLAEASLLEAQVVVSERVRQEGFNLDMEESEPNASLSEDTFSTFSAADEVAIDVSTFDPPMEDIRGEWEDCAALQRVANMLVQRRNANPASVVQKLVKMMNTNANDATEHAQFPSDLLGSLVPDGDKIAPISRPAPDMMEAIVTFEPNPVLPPRSTSMPHSGGVSATVQSASPACSNAVENIQRSPSIMAKASGFFQKLRPLLHGDISHPVRTLSRRFSFEAGDDAMTLSSQKENLVAISDKPVGLRKSVSLLSVSTKSYGTRLPPENVLVQEGPANPERPTNPRSTLTYCSNSWEHETAYRSGSRCTSRSCSIHADQSSLPAQQSLQLPVGSTYEGSTRPLLGHCTSTSATTAARSLITTSGTSHPSDHGADETSGTSCVCATTIARPIRSSSLLEIHHEQSRLSHCRED